MENKEGDKYIKTLFKSGDTCVTALISIICICPHLAIFALIIKGIVQPKLKILTLFITPISFQTHRPSLGLVHQASFCV